jgi:predicted dehydrogenase
VGEWKDDHIPLEHEQFNLEKGDALLEETRAFTEAITNNSKVVVSGRDGLKALRLAEKIIENALKRLA